MLAAVVVGSTVLVGCGDDDTATPTSTMADESDGVSEQAASRLEFTAVDIDYRRAEATASPGEVRVTLTNEGTIEHSWLVEGHEDDLRLYVPTSGATDEGTFTLGPGAYTFYCDIPGHRAAGMEGTLTVD